MGHQANNDSKWRQDGLERAGWRKNDKSEKHWSGVKQSFKDNRQKIGDGKKTLAKEGTRHLEPALQKTNVKLY